VGPVLRRQEKYPPLTQPIPPIRRQLGATTTMSIVSVTWLRVKHEPGFQGEAATDLSVAQFCRSTQIEFHDATSWLVYRLFHFRCRLVCPEFVVSDMLRGKVRRDKSFPTHENNLKFLRFSRFSSLRYIAT